MLLCMKMMDEFGLRNERLKLIVSDSINGGLETMTFNPFTLASHTKGHRTHPDYIVKNLFEKYHHSGEVSINND